MEFTNLINETSIRLTSKQKAQVASIVKVVDGYEVLTFPQYVFNPMSKEQTHLIVVKTIKEVKYAISRIGEYVDYQELNEILYDMKKARLIKDYKFARKFGYVEEMAEYALELENMGFTKEMIRALK